MDSVIWGKTEKLAGVDSCLCFRPQNHIQRLPVVYLFHGQHDTEADWFGKKAQLPGIFSGVGAPPMILITPFCGLKKLKSAKEQKDPGLEAFANRYEVIKAAVEKSLATHDGLRGLVGISMGGRQALYVALGGMLPEISALGVLSGKLQAPFAGELEALVGGWDPKAIANLSIYFHYCGYGGTDERFLEGNRIVCNALGGDLRTREDADHNWWFWRPQLAEFFRAFSGLVAEQAVAADDPLGRR